MVLFCTNTPFGAFSFHENSVRGGMRLATLATEKLAASLLMIGFEGTVADEALLRHFDLGFGGFILFKRNIDSAEQTAWLIFELKTRYPHLIASVDQEGGRVARLRGHPFTAIPSMRSIGQQGDVELARNIGRLLAFETRALGFDLNFAPVLDIDTNPLNPVIGDRALASTPHQVAKLGVALAQGLESGGVASCGKHFPGHGDTAQDSHLSLPVLSHALERLRQVELVPFEAYAKAKLASIMTAHVRFDAVDNVYPATMSPATLHGLLRQALQFEGVIISDDLEMKAIAHHFSIEEAVVRGVQAGVDLFLVCQSPDVQHRAVEALVHAIERGVLSTAELQRAQARIEGLRHRFQRSAELGYHRLQSPEHLAHAQGLQLEAVPQGDDPTERAARS
jgi:beta-N-acetylhexosaminidase